MGMSSLSQVLEEMGFHFALNTWQTIGRVKCQVERGEAMTKDQNGGIVVVYDETGSPWIIHYRLLTHKKIRKLGEFQLKRGAHVPHSNDSGKYIRTVQNVPDRS